MIRPFRLSDLFLIYRLQRQGVWLDPRHALIGYAPSAWAALSAPLRSWSGGSATYVSRVAGGGIIQMRPRPGRPEVDIVFLAPTLEGNEEIAALWRRLLFHCVQQAGEWQVQRLFVSVLEDAEETLSLFRQVGFVPYTREEAYCLEQSTGIAVAPRSHQVRPLTSVDSWALQKLHAAITPRLVQQAEGGGASQAGDPPLTWWAPGRWERMALVREREIAGLVLVETGWSGHCLRLWGDFHEDTEVLALLERGLAALAAYPRRPAYCLIREYQSGVRAPLAEHGFHPAATWSCLVKHTVVRAREPVRRAWPALEAQPKPSVPGAVPSGME